MIMTHDSPKIKRKESRLESREEEEEEMECNTESGPKNIFFQKTATVTSESKEVSGILIKTLIVMVDVGGLS